MVLVDPLGAEIILIAPGYAISSTIPLAFRHDWTSAQRVFLSVARSPRDIGLRFLAAITVKLCPDILDTPDVCLTLLTSEVVYLCHCVVDFCLKRSVSPAERQKLIQSTLKRVSYQSGLSRQSLERHKARLDI